jgi:DnaJ-class molecular chaperone
MNYGYPPVIRVVVSSNTGATSATFTGATFNWNFGTPRRPPEDPIGPYAVLGVPPKSPPDVVRKAYRDKLFETHPDHGGSDEAVRRVIEAYKRVS